jgi:hypothetical protein
MEQLIFKIGTNRNPILIDFKEYNNQKLVDIRKYFIDSNDSNNFLPTKKGISLNVNQLSQIIEVINSNSSSISDFFHAHELKQINIDVKPTIGRGFQCKYENNKTTVIIDEDFKKRLPSDSLLLFSKVIEAFNNAMSDVLEQEDEIELIMDVVNQRISRIL